MSALCLSVEACSTRTDEGQHGLWACCTVQALSGYDFCLILIGGEDGSMLSYQEDYSGTG